jgi:hypothetical protein
VASIVMTLTFSKGTAHKRLTFVSEEKIAKIGTFIIARSEATKQSSFGIAAWIASLCSQ